jgi:hypothetical protein
VWDRLAVPRPPDFPKVVNLPSTARMGEVANVTEARVFVATIAKVVRLLDHCHGDAAAVARLFAPFRAVFVDEGHYEPAAKWSEAIRALGLPTVLLTATPYRNDDKYFAIDDAHRFRYSHKQAVAEGFLRSPSFESIPGSADDFVPGLLRFMRETAGAADSRVIVRCADAETIRDTVRQLARAGQSVIGVHESFADTEGGALATQVPSPDSCSAQYWVHQFKLVEGIDDPEFRVVAFRNRLGNDRATIQQIGRALRNPARSETDTRAWVLSRDNFDVEQVWRSYLAFDETSGSSVATTPALARLLFDAQPASVYYDGHFRVPVDLERADAWKHFAFPMATRIYRVVAGGRLTLEGVTRSVMGEWRECDRDVRAIQRPDEQTVIIPYFSIGNSNFLRSASFIEADFGFTVIRMNARRLFVFDTQGRTPHVVSDNLAREPRDSLGRLLHGKSRLTSVSLDNTDVSRSAIRARTVRAAAIEELSPDLTDYSYVCSVAEGYPPVPPNGDPIRRYLGISRSRVRDHGDSEGTFEAYRSWLAQLEMILDDHGSAPTLTGCGFLGSTRLGASKGKAVSSSTQCWTITTRTVPTASSCFVFFSESREH